MNVELQQGAGVSPKSTAAVETLRPKLQVQNYLLTEEVYINLYFINKTICLGFFLSVFLYIYTLWFA